ncbi:MAG: LacI family DNA-binding transcriptional regulator [bacterium]|nr:LacI family DNA-binding transcriptional regulator [bacterium]
MTDVARLAGVSHQTVSRVINNHPSVREGTRQRVQEAIDQLGYRRNLVARQLATGSGRALGLVSVGTAHFGPASAIFAIAEASRQRGYFLNFAALTEIDAMHMREAIDYLKDSSVDAILVIAPVRAAVEALRDLDAGIPVIRIGKTAATLQAGLYVDNVEGARLATRHLLELGHRNVHHVSGPPDWVEAEARLRGWRAELDSQSINAPTVVAGDWSSDSGYQAGLELARSAELTAVFAANDQMALGVMRALEDSGRRVPQDVSVVGFDDVPDAAFFGPALTTVRQDLVEIGRRSVDAVLALVQGASLPSHEPVEPLLVIRESTTSPRSA